MHSVRDALDALVASETLEDYVCDKTKQPVSATRQMLFEDLPPILLLHMKRFVKDDITGGMQKCIKQIDYDTELIIANGKETTTCL